MKLFWVAYALWFPLWVVIGVLVFYGIKLDLRLQSIEERPMWPPYPTTMRAPQ